MLKYIGQGARVVCPRGEILVNDKTSQKDLKYILSRGIKLNGIIEEVEDVIIKKSKKIKEGE